MRVVGALRSDERGGVRELGAGPGREAADLLGPPVGRAVVDDHGGGREGAERGVGVTGGVYDNALFEEGRGHLLVYRPTADPPRGGRVHPVTLPAVELAVTTHVGEHDDIDVTYGELGAWVVANALVVAGPVREAYLVGPRDTAEPSTWRTEIGWPVFQVDAR